MLLSIIDVTAQSRSRWVVVIPVLFSSPPPGFLSLPVSPRRCPILRICNCDASYPEVLDGTNGTDIDPVCPPNRISETCSRFGHLLVVSRYICHSPSSLIGVWIRGLINCLAVEHIEVWGVTIFHPTLMSFILRRSARSLVT